MQEERIFNMEELDKTIKELHTFQKWRRGANIEMPNPKELGKTIDNTIRILRKIKKDGSNNYRQCAEQK